ncbi:hypothetical protein Agabi119p4_2510 [Agaricus bisporus var. burnettii]|uniref:Uncharacterized protein n=1 Tax=Agaricus bisporus var. burnettii TaxID=192524 RepID=A0A8H7KK18_AGABI|nr:hypothetical protein Agabi119p4_2510 [Agaricus bisporus var. burnettii]
MASASSTLRNRRNRAHTNPRKSPLTHQYFNPNVLIETYLFRCPLLENGSQTLYMVTTKMTPDGPVTATCTIVLSPITDENGQAAVQKVETCTFVPNPATNPNPSQPPTSASPGETSPQDSPATSLSSTSTDGSATSSAVPITTASAESSGGSGAISVNPVSTVTVSSSSTQISSSSNGAVSTQPVSTVTPITSTSVTSPTKTSSSPGTSTLTGAETTSDASSTSAVAENTSDATSTPSAAAEISSDAPSTTSTASAASSATAVPADTSNAAVSLPGKKLAVLPIGLGVFAVSQGFQAEETSGIWSSYGLWRHGTIIVTVLTAALLVYCSVYSEEYSVIPRLLDEIKMLKDSGLAAEVHSGRLHNLEVHALLACKDISTPEVLSFSRVGISSMRRYSEASEHQIAPFPGPEHRLKIVLFLEQCENMISQSSGIVQGVRTSTLTDLQGANRP